MKWRIDPGLVDEIRRATNGNFALGDARFTDQIAAALNRRATPGLAGRPRKQPDAAASVQTTLQLDG